MKTVFKALVLTAVLMAGLQAQAATVTCFVSTEEKAGDYTKLVAQADVLVGTDEGTLLLNERGYPLKVNGLSFSVSKTSDGFGIAAASLADEKAVGIASSNGGSYIALVLPQHKLSIVCQENAR